MSVFLRVACALASVTSLRASIDNIDTDKNNSTIAIKSSDFEEVIKNNLRKNNDDYPLEQQYGADAAPAPEAARRFNMIPVITPVNFNLPNLPFPSKNPFQNFSPAPQLEGDTTHFRSFNDMQMNNRNAKGDTTPFRSFNNMQMNNRNAKGDTSHFRSFNDMQMNNHNAKGDTTHFRSFNNMQMNNRNAKGDTTHFRSFNNMPINNRNAKSDTTPFRSFNNMPINNRNAKGDTTPFRSFNDMKMNNRNAKGDTTHFRSFNNMPINNRDAEGDTNLFGSFNDMQMNNRDAEGDTTHFKSFNDMQMNNRDAEGDTTHFRSFNNMPINNRDAEGDTNLFGSFNDMQMNNRDAEGDTTHFRSFNDMQMNNRNAEGDTTLYRSFNDMQGNNRDAEGDTTLYRSFNDMQRNSHDAEGDTTFFKSFNDMQMNNRDARKLAQRSKDKYNEQDRPSRADVTTKDGHAEKWKRLVDKNKRLFLYTSSSKIAPSVAAAAMNVAQVRTHARTPKTSGETKSKSNQGRAGLHPIQKVQKPGGGRMPVYAVRLWRTTPPLDRRPPNADQLDMAPARGAYIHDLRLKGRFCHRHVLWPEGPKYDSKGSIIMPAFDAKKYNKGRLFQDTTRAMFVLPRCCNCCKKSVLGCQ